MAIYKYSITTKRDEKGKPIHSYEGERNTAEYMQDMIYKPREKFIKPLSAKDKMAKKISSDVKEWMKLNPHISGVEVIVEEIK